MMGYGANIDALIEDASRRTGVPVETLRAFVSIESSGRPDAVTGSYRGLLQLSDNEFRRYGGQGNIFDPSANLNAGATKLKAESDRFAARYGRQPTADELYMLHQQGEGGAAAHMSNPSAPAWRNMASTAEGRQKGEGWARKAIWGNVPTDVRDRYGSVDNITSQQFMDLWRGKVSRFGGASAPAQAAIAPIHQTGVGRETPSGNGFSTPPEPTQVAEAMPSDRPANAFADHQPYQVEALNIAAPDNLPSFARRRSYV